MIGAKVQEAVQDLEKRFAVPEPEEPFTLIHQFSPDEPTVTRGGITSIAAGWQIEAYEDTVTRLNASDPLRKVILFEVAAPEVAECILACRFQAKALNTEKSINVQLYLCKQHQLVTTSRVWSTGVSPTENFRSLEVCAHFKKDSAPTKIQVTIEFESPGLLQIRNIELLQAAVKVPSNC